MINCFPEIGNFVTGRTPLENNKKNQQNGRSKVIVLTIYRYIFYPSCLFIIVFFFLARPPKRRVTCAHARWFIKWLYRAPCESFPGTVRRWRRSWSKVQLTPPLPPKTFNDKNITGTIYLLIFSEEGGVEGNV